MKKDSIIEGILMVTAGVAMLVAKIAGNQLDEKRTRNMINEELDRRENEKLEES